LKLFANADKLKAIENGKRTAPLYIRIKPTNLCNHRCYYCSQADEALGLIKEIKFPEKRCMK